MTSGRAVNGLIVDTSTWIQYFKNGGYPEIDLALKEGRVYLPPVVAAELISGIRKVAQKKELEAFLGELPLCESNLDHWIRVGSLRSMLLSKAFTISTPDAHIAQCAIDLGCYLLTEDMIFSKIAKAAGLRILMS